MKGHTEKLEMHYTVITGWLTIRDITQILVFKNLVNSHYHINKLIKCSVYLHEYVTLQNNLKNWIFPIFKVRS
jgi:hypothetical protein